MIKDGRSDWKKVRLVEVFENGWVKVIKVKIKND